ncbi:MAG TPA: malto-oligosyltrehalose trehalohydrolase [Kofleriaceae bacterium]|jgi:maltooligosyltrehalose trehalohydrolase|nr:malto-oligosyltrehalose trehalohydrolase [Kofleriaceae bacterium]
MPAPPRRLPIGTEVATAERGAHVRVWAPDHPKVALVIEDGAAPRELVLGREPSGHHSGFAPGLVAGGRYRFRLGDAATLYPDPASRYQPDGPFGPSQVVDPGAFAWTDAGWTGIPPERHVIYELHIGTFTPEGTWTAAAEWLDYLAELGITTIELMPIAEFAGRHGWGYDGVDLFAPYHPYGTPDELRRFIDRAHARGLAVILDVVYNHFGPAGNFMFAWSPAYRTDRSNEWGDTLNFDGEGSAGTRELVVANAGYWIDEFHFDGLRLDATQAIHDRSASHVLGELARRARAAAPHRHVFLVAENEPQDTALLAPAIGLDAMWNDDFHHAARVTLTGMIEGYLHDYRGTPQELVSAIKRGFLYQGQLYPWQHNPRGTSTRGLARHRFVHFLDNHDQASNIGFGERLTQTADAGLLRALTAVLLLSPELPLVFQGQEHGAPQPWRFFVDHGPELHAPIRAGRARFMAQFPALATAEAQAALYDPCAEATFRGCVLDPRERRLDHPQVALHRDLLRLRRDDPAFTDPRPEALDGAVLSDHAFVVRYLQDDPARDRLLLVNLGPTFLRPAVPEPLVAPPAGGGWRVAWSSEDPRYGGHGTPPVFNRARLAIPARAAILLAPDAETSLHVDLPIEDSNRPPEV